MEKEPNIFKKSETDTGRDLINEYSGLFNRLEKIILEKQDVRLLNELSKLKEEFKTTNNSNSILIQKLEELVRKIESNQSKSSEIEEVVEKINKELGL